MIAFATQKSDRFRWPMAVWFRLLVMTAAFAVLVQIGLLAAGRFSAGLSAQGAVTSEITALALAEAGAVLALSVLLARDGRSLRDLGLWRNASPLAWALGLTLGLATTYLGLSNPALHLPSRLAAVFDPSPWHLYCALVAGTAAGFCEEIIFRGFVMQELAAAGHGRTMQITGSALFFGIAHVGLLRAGVIAGLMVIVPTAVLGALYAGIYLLGRRSLMPVIASHFLNDAAVIPLIFLAVASQTH